MSVLVRTGSPLLPATAFAVLVLALVSSAGAQLLDRTGVHYGPTLEWELDNPTVFGNPFDVEATATFVHSTGEIASTGLFYDGGETWRFRFAPHREGEWTFTTASLDPDLDGHAGTVTVLPNPSPDVRGFLTSVGTRFAHPTSGGDLEPYRFDFFQNGVLFDPHIAGSDWTDPAVRQAYFAEARAHGFDAVLFSVYNSWFEFGARAYTEHVSFDPDLVTFDVLEQVIEAAWAEGIHVHLLAWGDEQRQWTPLGVGGINGVPDRRLQRTIAARLGPLPGWSMTYGFDLEEWVSEAQVGAWASYLGERFGWEHLVWAKGRVHGDLSALALSGIGADSPEEIADLIAIFPDRPIVYEERFTHGRFARYDMDGTRRQLWRHAIAGGVGAGWGFFDTSPHPYPSPEQLITYDRFWRDRLRFGYETADSATDGWGLADDGGAGAGAAMVFYREGAASVEFDLSVVFATPQPAIAVDTRQVYTELAIGPLDPVAQTWIAPYESDWAIAVGAIGLPDTTPPTSPTMLSITATDTDRVELSWLPGMDADSGISSYRVERDGVEVATVLGTLTHYTDVGLADATSYDYAVAAVNGGGQSSPFTPIVTATTTIDDVPPFLVGAGSFGNDERVEVTFSEAVAAGTALDPLHYSLSPTVAVLGVSPTATPERVVLEVEPLLPETVYTLSVTGVTDQATTPNPIAPGSSIDFVFHPRVTDGLQLLYDFSEGAGATIFDRSGVAPLYDLTILEPDRVAWSTGALTIVEGTIISNVAPPAKLHDACSASDAVTIEAWVVPASTAQSGPARIVSLSFDTQQRNFTLGQDGAAYDVRLRTTTTSDNGTPSVALPGLTAELAHIVYTRAADGSVSIYRDGVLEGTDSRGGDFSNWNDTHRFALANEHTEDRDWLGTLHLVAVYSRALSFDEVAINFEAGPGATGTGVAGLQRPSDLSQDGVVDVTDGIATLAYLFGTSSVPLPCATEAANRTLLDANGDGNLDLVDVIVLLEYLFQLGPPPALGEDCVPISECPTGCP